MWAGVAILVMCLKFFLCVVIMILILEFKVVLHHATHVLSTSTVQVAIVLFKLELKWDRDFSPFW